jgi:hypothetical protein
MADILNVTRVTLPEGLANIHGFCKAGNYIFAGTRQSPASIIRFNDVNDLSDITVLTFPPDNDDPLHDGMINCEGMVYNSVTGMVYGIFDSYEYFACQVNRIIEIDPATFPDYHLCINETVVSEDPGEYPHARAIAVDEVNNLLYVAYSWRDGFPVRKYSLVNRDIDGHLILENGDELVIGPPPELENPIPHSLNLDGDYLYLTFCLSGAVAKIKVSDMSLVQIVYYSQPEVGSITDDVLIRDGYIWAGIESGNNIGNILKISTADLTDYSYIVTGINPATACFGIYFFDGLIWAVHAQTGEATLTFIEPASGAVITHTIADTTHGINEIVQDDNGLFHCPTWGDDPAVMLSFVPPYKLPGQTPSRRYAADFKAGSTSDNTRLVQPDDLVVLTLPDEASQDEKVRVCKAKDLLPSSVSETFNLATTSGNITLSVLVGVAKETV